MSGRRVKTGRVCKPCAPAGAVQPSRAEMYMYLGPKRADVVEKDGEDMGDNRFEDFKLQNHTFYREQNGSKLYFMLDYTNIRFNHSLIEIDLNDAKHYYNGNRPKKDVQKESTLMITKKNINTYKEDMVKLFFAYIQNTAQEYYRQRNIMYTTAVNVENPADKFTEMDKYSEETKEKVAECKEQYAKIQNVVKENELEKINKKIETDLENYVTGFDFANYEQEMIDIMKNNLTASRDALFECADSFPREIAALKAKADAEVTAKLAKAEDGEEGVGGEVPQAGGNGKGFEDGSGGGNGEGDAVAQAPQPGAEGSGADVAGNVDEYSLDRYNIKEGVLPTAGVWVYDPANNLVGKYNNDTFQHKGKQKTQGSGNYYWYTTKSGEMLHVRKTSLLNVLEVKKTATAEAKAAEDTAAKAKADEDAAAEAVEKERKRQETKATGNTKTEHWNDSTTKTSENWVRIKPLLEKFRKFHQDTPSEGGGRSEFSNPTYDKDETLETWEEEFLQNEMLWTTCLIDESIVDEKVNVVAVCICKLHYENLRKTDTILIDKVFVDSTSKIKNLGQKVVDECLKNIHQQKIEVQVEVDETTSKTVPFEFKNIYAIVIYKNYRALSFFMYKFKMTFTLGELCMEALNAYDQWKETKYDDKAKQEEDLKKLVINKIINWGNDLVKKDNKIEGTEKLRLQYHLESEVKPNMNYSTDSVQKLYKKLEDILRNHCSPRVNGKRTHEAMMTDKERGKLSASLQSLKQWMTETNEFSNIKEIESDFQKNPLSSFNMFD